MFRIASFSAVFLVLAACSESDQKSTLTNASNEIIADTVYTHGQFYTVDESRPWAEAVAIKNGEFLIVGSNAEVEAVSGDETEVIDLAGRFVMPGLHDLHLHFEGFYNATMLEGKTLRYAGTESSIEELQAKLEAYAEANPDLAVLFAEQLPQALFPNLSPTRAFIDEVVPDRPVVMLSDSEHEALLNTRALAMEGITAETPDPVGGEIVKDSEGQPTGYLKERAAGMWGWPHFPELTREQHKQGMLGVIKFLNTLGITTAKEQHAKNHWAQGFKDVETDGDLTMRIGLSWTYNGPLEPSPLEEQESAIENRKKFESELINPNFVKLSIDGNAGTTGLVVEPYEQTGDYGIAFYAPEELVNDVARFDEMGLGITAHANADGAVRQLLDALEEARNRNGQLNGRHQVAHAILIHPDDLSRFGPLDATAEFSPVMWSPNPTAGGLAAQLGPERIAHVFPMKSLSESGGRFILASDGPLFWQTPMEAIETAVTRQKSGGSTETLGASEAIDLETAIRAYTINAAYLMSHDDRVGSIEKGKAADMIVLDRNLFEVPSNQIGEATVLKTIFNGSIVFDTTVDPSNEAGIEDKYETELDLEGEEWGHKP
jgi:predicted amidohydrolase YtcJ